MKDLIVGEIYFSKTTEVTEDQKKLFRRKLQALMTEWNVAAMHIALDYFHTNENLVEQNK